MSETQYRPLYSPLLLYDWWLQPPGIRTRPDWSGALRSPIQIGRLTLQSECQQRIYSNNPLSAACRAPVHDLLYKLHLYVILFCYTQQSRCWWPWSGLMFAWKKWTQVSANTRKTPVCTLNVFTVNNKPSICKTYVKQSAWMLCF